MDRAKKDKLPKMQVGFIDSICLPIYTVSYHEYTQLAFTCSKLTLEALEQSVKYVQSYQ